MMDLINKIYNSEYFVVGLLILIAVLALIFIILIFSGKKSKKENNNTESNNIEQNLDKISNLALNTSTTVSPNQPDVIMPQDVTSDNQVETLDTSVPEVSTVQPSIDNINPSLPATEPITPVDANKPNEDLFNTSIFHGAPIDLASVNDTKPEEKEDTNNVTSGLFEPVPNFGETLETKEEVKEETNNEVVDKKEKVESVPPVTPAAPVEDTPKEEAPKMPNQFSSVHINKEEEPKETTVNTDNSNNNTPAYDPELFTSIINPKKVEELENKKDNVEENPVVNNEEEKKDVNPTNDTFFNSMPQFDLPSVKPALEPMDDVNDNSTVQINPNNTFNFDLPNLASTDDFNNSGNETVNTNNNE